MSADSKSVSNYSTLPVTNAVRRIAWTRKLAKTIAEVVPSCNLFEFLRLLEVDGRRRNKVLSWRAKRPRVLTFKPRLQLRIGGSRMHIDAKYALFLFSPNAMRDRINAMDGLAATNELIDLI